MSSSDAASHASEDESDEEEERHLSRNKSNAKRKRKRKSSVSHFIEDDVEVDDDEGEDEEEEHGYGGERAEAETEATILHDQTTQKRYDQSRERRDAESAEDIVNRIKKRHVQNQRRYDDEEDDVGSGNHTAVNQQSLLPSVKDPKLWIFKCKPGKENNLVLSIMNKYIDCLSKGTPLQIISAVASSTKGFIYIEAEREPHAKAAVQGLREIQPWSMKLVPIQEMAAVMTITSRKKPIVAGTYARIKRAGLYKGDLCKVMEVLDSSTRALVQIVPRLDPAALGGAQNYSKGQRPAAKLLSVTSAIQGDLARKRHPILGEMLDVLDGDYYHNGFLIKEFNINSMLLTEDVVPNLDEMKRFSSDPNETEEAVGDNAWSKEVELAKGDTVRVIEGDLINLMGIVVGMSSSADAIKVMPLHEEIRDTILDFQRKQLMKFVKVGDHVKVICGRYSGETGTVVSVDESDGAPIAIVLSDSMAKEIQVRVRDIQESAEVSTGLDSLKGKQLYDLVMLSHGDVGVITHVGRDSFKVILQSGQARDVPDAEIQRVLQSNRAAALDKQRNHITPGEMVSVVDGPNMGQTGTIKHLYRSFVFIHNNKVVQNAGIFVEKSRNVILAGSKARSNMTQNSQVGPPGRRQMTARRDDRDSDMIGKTVKIKRGIHKGYLGMVVEETEQKVKVEIHSKSLSVDVDKQHILIAGNRLGRETDMPRTSATPMVGATPLASQTPMHSGSMTPMHPGTPMHSGIATPTPHTPSADVWNPSAKAPMDTHHNEPDTPAYGNFHTPMEPVTPAAPLAATPGYYNPSTPGAFAYTPAADMHHHTTPGPVTPGSGYNTNTPGMGVGTPGNYAPLTPGGLVAMTPGSMHSPMPATPYVDDDNGMGNGGNMHATTWVSRGLVVQVTSGDHPGVVGTVTAVQNDGMCSLQNDTSGSVIQVSVDTVIAVLPEKHDKIKVLRGEEAGQLGMLIGTDGDDGIVKMDGTSEINIYNLSWLAKLV